MDGWSGRRSFSLAIVLPHLNEPPCAKGELRVTQPSGWSIYLCPFLLTYQAVLDTIAPASRRDGVAPRGAVEARAFGLPAQAVARRVG